MTNGSCLISAHKLFVNTKWGHLTRKKKKNSLFRTGVDSAPLVYFSLGFASQPKLQVQYDGSKSKWELSNLISPQSSKHESWLYTPVKIQQWADRNVEKNMAGMNIFLIDTAPFRNGTTAWIPISMISRLQDLESDRSWHCSCIYELFISCSIGRRVLGTQCIQLWPEL